MCLTSRDHGAYPGPPAKEHIPPEDIPAVLAVEFQGMMHGTLF
jgi:hypothetical protein